MKIGDRHEENACVERAQKPTLILKLYKSESSEEMSARKKSSTDLYISMLGYTHLASSTPKQVRHSREKETEEVYT